MKYELLVISGKAQGISRKLGQRVFMSYEMLAAMVWCWLRDRNGNTFYPAGVKRLVWIARPER